MMQPQANSQHQIVHFLRTDGAVARLDFSMMTYKIAPKDYRDVATAIERGDILMSHRRPAGGAAAAYNAGYDGLELQRGFKLGNGINAALLVHECTHAILDLRNIGSHSRYEDEAVAYVAEELFQLYERGTTISAKGSSHTAASGAAIYQAAIAIAKVIANNPGNRNVPTHMAKTLVDAVRATPIYARNTPKLVSNRFNRTFTEKCGRFIAGL